MTDNYVSVVIPALNSAATIATQLDALASQTRPPDEVIVADNGSTDGTPEYAAAYRAMPVRVVDASARRGPSAARNAGAGAAKGEVVLFCDADDRVSPSWVSDLLEASAHYDVFGGRVEDLDTAEGRPRRIPRVNLDLPRDLAWHPWPIGANCGIRKSAIMELGGWDEDLLAGEEIDLAWRAVCNGLRVGVVEGAPVQYRQRGTAREAYRQGVLWGKAAPTLYKRFHRFGFARRPVIHFVKDISRLALGTPELLASPADRVAAARLAGLLIGRLLGSAKEGVFYV